MCLRPPAEVQYPVSFCFVNGNQARRELAATMIQSNLRRLFAQKQLLELKRLRDEALAHERKIQAAAVLIQSVARMREGQ